MKVTINKDASVNIEGMNVDELVTLAELLNNIEGKNRKKFADVVKKLMHTPINKVPSSSSLQENKKLISFAQQVMKMRNLQKVYFKTRQQVTATIEQQEKVDDMINDILNQL